MSFLADQTDRNISSEVEKNSASAFNPFRSMKKSTTNKSYKSSLDHQHRLKSINSGDIQSSPEFHSLPKNRTCKHHLSNGNLPTADESLSTTMPYISQQFHTLDSSNHHQPYYENITDSIQIHEASMINDPSNSSTSCTNNNDESFVENSEHDQLHRNSLYRSDSGISNSSYDCATPVPAPRPNSRKCQSVPVYMNLPGKNCHPTRCQNGSSRSRKGRSDVSLINELDDDGAQYSEVRFLFFF